MRVLRIGMSGSDVMEIQSALRKLGFYISAPDGYFGQQTYRAVVEFQRAHGLSPDGVIGRSTFAVLQPYLLGYDTYTVIPGDTFYGIARKYGANVAFVMAANPNSNPKNLQPGQNIIVPYDYPVVDTDISYTYDVLQRDIRGLRIRYPFIETGAAGYSALGRRLDYLRLGRGGNEVFYIAAIHALEWITAPVMMKFIEDFCASYVTGELLAGYDTRAVWDASSIYIMPMVNPDGADLVINGLQPGNPNYNELILWNNGSTDFSSDWQANNNGVDLNHNFNAAWEQSKQAAEEMGITGPGPTRYPGPYPESEPESKTVADFTRAHDFRLVLAYHSQGGVIYWNFMGLEPPESLPIGEALAADSGYVLEQAAGITSYAGFKDWFIQDYRRPGYTVEVGLGKNPLPVSQFGDIYASNLPLLLHASII